MCRSENGKGEKIGSILRGKLWKSSSFYTGKYNFKSRKGTVEISVQDNSLFDAPFEMP